MNMTRTLGIISATLLLCSCSQEDVDIIAKSTENYRDDFIKAAAKLVEDSDTPGVAVAIIKGDGRRWTHGFGFEDLETKKPMTENTVISIGSVSKTITGVAIMQTVEKGLLDLDADVNEYLPFNLVNPKYPAGIITPRHVLTHTTGIVDNSTIYHSEIGYHPGGDNPIALGDFVKGYLTPSGKYYSESDNFMDTPPGDGYRYTNVGFGLAGHLVENVTSKPFNVFTRENIFQPLGMNSTGWMYSEVDEDLLGKQYGNKDGEPQEALIGPAVGSWRAYRKYGLATYPDGGLRTSVSDLGNFLTAVMNKGSFNGKRIMEEATVDAMLAPQRFGHERIPNIRGIKDQAIAFVYEVPGMIGGPSWTRIGHNGGDPGTTTFMYYEPTTKTGIIYFTNSDILTRDQIHATQTIINSLVVHADDLVN